MQETVDNSRQWCYGCGERNEEGLRITFRLEEGRAVGSFVPRTLHQGYPGLAHGGIAAAALDEAMGWAMYASGTWGMTARMEVRYRRPLHPGHPVSVRGEVTAVRGKWLEAVGEIRGSNGELLVEGNGLFARLSEERAKELEAFYVAVDVAGHD